MFTEATLTFLNELEDHNDRAWFAKNKVRYERDVRDPALAFVRAVGESLPEVSSAFLSSEKRVGGSLMRVYRDTRFSKDKSPYKTNIGIQFRHAAGKDVHAPGLYVHVELGQAFVACGLWRPESAALKRIRTHMVANAEAYSKVIRDPVFTEVFALQGESLKRAPRGFDAEHPLIDELKRKSIIAVSDLAMEDVLGERLVELTLDRFARGAPFVRFLCDAVGQPF
ncbi:MAG: hypothetical protein ACI8PZ_003345 [Myxococcota bacterium]|jgi:uncharacterized protein (TIGR02453 family)